MPAAAGPQLPPDSTGKVTGAFNFGAAPVIYLPAGVIVDSAGNEVVSATAAPAGTERGLIVRPIPSGTQAVSGTFWQATQPVSGTFWQATQPISAAALPLPAGAATDATMTGGTQIAQLRASTLVVTGTAAAGTGVTVTLPLVASQFHYITSINIVKYASVATVGAAAATVVTSTNLPGSLAWTLPTALAVGTQYEHDVEPASPIKSSLAGTATTIVAAALASIIYRITVYYYAAV